MNRLIQSAVLLVAVASAPAWAQSKSDIQRMQPHLGVLAPDCSNYMLPQLKHLGDSLVVQDGGKAVLTGRNVKPAPKYFGATPPPEFETAFTSEVAGGEALVFVYYRNASGLFAAVEGGPKVMAALPAAFKGKRARHCDPNRNAVPGAGVPSEQAKADPNKFKGYALTELSASGLLYNPKAKATYYKALGPLPRSRGWRSWMVRARRTRRSRSPAQTTCWSAPARTTTASRTTSCCSIRARRMSSTARSTSGVSQR